MKKWLQILIRLDPRPETHADEKLYWDFLVRIHGSKPKAFLFLLRSALRRSKDV